MSPSSSDKPAQRLLQGLAQAVDLPLDVLTRAGTTVVGHSNRAGTGIATCYHVGPAAVVWTDPAIEDRFVSLADGSAAVSAEQFSAHMAEIGFVHLADSCMRVLPSHNVDMSGAPHDYRHHQLTNDDVDVIQSLVDQCVPNEVDEAGLEDLDDFNEAAINVLSVSPAGDLVAYASAGTWSWDETFADIGVLVHPSHRRQGLGRWVVARTVADLLDAGRLPLYRHMSTNHGSASLSTGLGFETVLWLQAYRLSSHPSGD